MHTIAASSVPSIPTWADLDAARERVRIRAHRTPVLTSHAADAEAQAQLFFKCENLQRVGAFKFRGACNAIFSLAAHVAARGVATHSSGNHAQAVALAARLRGISAHVVMPRDAPAVKRRAVEGYGARIIDCASTLEDRETTLGEVLAETGATEVHPYNDPQVVAGQATAALELLEDVPELDALLTPVGGGGLLGGTALAARYCAPSVEVYGAEPVLADDAAEGLRIGIRQPPRPPRTVADGLRTALGPLSFAILQRSVTGIVTVEEDEIASAMRFIWERMKMVIEPSAAVPVAAAFQGAFTGRRVGIVLSGGNVDLDGLLWCGRCAEAREEGKA